jgi:tRNA threonylcarbamoyladenosine biosynthesis protein TsaB
MPSLREICTLSPAVLLDAASSLVQVGVLQPDGTGQWQTSTDESGVAVFDCLRRLGLAPDRVECWIFCEGPGSVLGIRTVAMALRTWGVLRQRPVFGYSSLAVVAHAMGRRDLSVITDARRESWHHFKLGGSLRRVATAQLEGELVMPENFRHWSQLPPAVTRVPYTLADLLPRVWDADLLRVSATPDAYLPEEPNYVTWTPQIHRAPTPA